MDVIVQRLVMTVGLVGWVAAVSWVAGCGGSPPVIPPLPVAKTIQLTWEPGSCTDLYRIYRETTGEPWTAVGTTNIPMWSMSMVPIASNWQVAGSCGEEEHLSAVVQLRP